MLKKIGTDAMRKCMGEILDCVNLRGDEFIIERKHKPLAALIPVSKLEALSKMAKEFVLGTIAAQDSYEEQEDEEQEEIDLLANEAKHQTRKKKKR